MLISVFAAVVCGGLGAVDPSGENRALAEDVARAMLVHDQSVRTLEWKQKVHFFRPDGTLRLGTEHHVVFSETGAYKEDCTSHYEADPEDGSPEESIRSCRAFDGNRYIGLGGPSQSGVVRDYGAEQFAFHHLDVWLGRHLDSFGHVRLGTILLRADNLAMDFSGRGLPVLCRSMGSGSPTEWSSRAASSTAPTRSRHARPSPGAASRDSPR
jgi:hypothetical protein